MKTPWPNPPFKKTTKSILKALFLTIGLFVLFFAFFHLLSSVYTDYLAQKEINSFHQGLNKDLDHLKAEGDAVAKNQQLIDSLLANNGPELLKITRQEIQDRNIGLMGVANKQGVILSRTLSPGVIGDNVFLTTPGGRSLAKNQPFKSFERTGFGRQVFLTTGRLVESNGETIGAIFANYLADDNYATNFKSKYLTPGVEIIFYGNDFGVYGDSFANKDIRTLVTSYFNSGSDWIQNGETNKTISFENGNYYLAENIPLPGLEETSGGAILFIPRKDISNLANLLTALGTLGMFIFLVLKAHLETLGEERGWRYLAIVTMVSVPVLFLTYLSLRIQNIGLLKLGKVPYSLYNSTLRLQPESGVYDKDFQQKINIIADTGDESINAIQIGLDFDPSSVNITSLDTDDSACSYVIENKIDQKVGHASLDCIIVDPPQNVNTFSVATIVVKPKQIGSFDIHFNPEETKILANDGLATDVLRMSQDGSYRVGEFNKKTENQNLVIFSPTHSNQVLWYNEPKAFFVWNDGNNKTYRYSLDADPNGTPTNDHVTKGSNISILIPGDGEFYFHLQATLGGPISTYKIRSDLTPPTITEMNLSSNDIKVGDVVRLSFKAEDPRSGVQHNYYVDLGNHLFLPSGPQLYIPFLEAGDQKVTLRVYDAAGNYSEKTQTVHVTN